MRVRISWGAVVVPLFFGVGACTRTSLEPIREDPKTSPLPSVTATPPKTPASVSRVHGDVEGRFELQRARVAAFAPVVAELAVRSKKGPIAIFVGGDQRNEAMYPMRIAISATDAKGSVVCDSVAKPGVWSFGGVGSERTFAEGETFRETAVLNAMCPALATPGDYRIVLHRRLAPGAMHLKKPGKTIPLSCDLHPVHEGALPPGTEPGCVPMMDALPSVTTELSLHVDAFSEIGLHGDSERALSELSAAHDAIGRERAIAWLCGWVACGCPTTTPGTPRKDADVIAALPSSPPPTFPTSCRGGKGP